MKSQPIRIISWNIRAGGGKRAQGILQQLLDWKADIIGLCEFRATPASQWLAQQLHEAGFCHQLETTSADATARNALLLVSRTPIQLTTLATMPDNPERWLLARVEALSGLTLGMMHIPNYTSPTLKYPYMASVIDTMQNWSDGPGLMMGDTNCGKRGIDEERPSTTVFRREHDWIVDIENSDWEDSFRHLHGDRREYSWYSHRNNGFRLDYAFCSPTLVPAIKKVQHCWGHDPSNPERREALSDHAALILDLDIRKIKN